MYGADIDIEEMERFEIWTRSDYVLAGSILDRLLKRDEPYTTREVEAATALVQKIAAFPIRDVCRYERTVGQGLEVRRA